MTQQTRFIIIGILIILGIFVYTSSRNSNEDMNVSDTETENVLVLNYTGTSTPVQTLEVMEGETVTIKASSNVADELHVHGYDKSIDLTPNFESTIQFTADMTGSFEIELEEKGILLGTLEVYPL